MVKNALEDPPPAAVPLTKAKRKPEFDPEVRKKFPCFIPEDVRRRSGAP